MLSDEYPETVIEILDDTILFSGDLLRAMARFATSRPWHGPLAARQEKFLRLNHDLAKTRSIREPMLEFEALGGGSSVTSYYLSREHRIVMVGKLSVVTFLHEFAHALGCDERGACRWSINLFRKCFPRQYSKLIHVGHTLIRPRDNGASSSNASVDGA
jgi:hypothetical protein